MADYRLPEVGSKWRRGSTERGVVDVTFAWPQRVHYREPSRGRWRNGLCLLSTWQRWAKLATRFEDDP